MTVQRILKYSVKNIRSALLLAPLFPVNVETLAWHFSLHCITWHSRNFYMGTKSFMVITSIVGRKRGFSLSLRLSLCVSAAVTHRMFQLSSPSLPPPVFPQTLASTPPSHLTEEIQVPLSNQAQKFGSHTCYGESKSHVKSSTR